MAIEIFAEGVVGGVGGFVGRSASFPFDTMNVKMATQNKTTKASPSMVLRRILEEEGVGGLYRGVLISACEAMYQKFFYVVFFTYTKRVYRGISGGDVPTLGVLLCGYVSDIISATLTVPLESTVVKLQAAPVGASRQEIIRDTLFKKEGLTKALQSARSYFVISLRAGIEFALFDRIKQAMVQRGGPKDLSSGSAFMLGALTRAIATLFIYPYKRGKALTQALGEPNATAALMKVIQTEGLLAPYRGLNMELSRGVSQMAFMMMVMERIRGLVYKILLGRR
jgi:adenine nucleotide transporter 17